MNNYIKIAWTIYGTTIAVIAVIFLAGFGVAKIWFPREVITAEFIISTSTTPSISFEPEVISILKEQKDCEEKSGKFDVRNRVYDEGPIIRFGYTISCHAPHQPDIFNYEIQ